MKKLNKITEEQISVLSALSTLPFSQLGKAKSSLNSKFLNNYNISRIYFIVKKTLLIFLLLGTYAIAKEETSATKFVTFNPEFVYKMLDPNQDLQKINILLEERKKGTIKNNSLTIGISLISIFDYQKSNTDSKFAYLMRHPTENNQIGKEVSEFVIHSFQFSFTGAVNDWLAAHAEILYNPEQSFGSGTITALGRNQLELRKGFVLFGDLNKFPLYGAIGKMDAPFGQTGSVNPFTNSTIWHVFGGLGYGAQIGFKKWNLHLQFMAVQGGSQFRAMHTPVGDSTSVPSKINNFAADFNYNFNILDNANLFFGASYLHGSAYCGDFPIKHFSDCGDNNPAITYYSKLTINDRLVLKGSFATTLKVWEGTHNPTPPLDIYEASKVSSLDLGIKYEFNKNDKIIYTVSGEFSNFIAGPDGSPWERQNQIVIGVSAMFNKSSKIFLELFKTDGYVPFNFISGSDDYNPFPPGTTHSLRSANSLGLVVGAQITL